MIRFNCHKCDIEIEVEDALENTKHECLGCGDINTVPSNDTQSTKDSAPIDSKDVDRAAQAGLPPDFGPEVRVQIVRRCWFRSRAIRFSFVALAVMLGLIGSIWVPVTDKSLLWYLLIAPVVVSSIALLVYWWVDRLGASLEITTKRTIVHHGILSKSSSEVVHDNIRNIQIHQTFLQRLMQVGEIGISSSGQDGIELQINHLKDPDNLRKIIDLYRPL